MLPRARLIQSMGGAGGVRGVVGNKCGETEEDGSCLSEMENHFKKCEQLGSQTAPPPPRSVRHQTNYTRFFFLFLFFSDYPQVHYSYIRAPVISKGPHESAPPKCVDTSASGINNESLFYLKLIFQKLLLQVPK